MHHVPPGKARRRNPSLPHQSHESVRTGYQAHQGPAQGHILAEHPARNTRIETPNPFFIHALFMPKQTHSILLNNWTSIRQKGET